MKSTTYTHLSIAQKTGNHQVAALCEVIHRPVLPVVVCQWKARSRSFPESCAAGRSGWERGWLGAEERQQPLTINE